MSTRKYRRVDLSNCKYCKGPLIWATTENGKKMPLDAKARYFFVTEGSHCKTVKGHTSHFETCEKYRRIKVASGNREAKKPAISTRKAVQQSIVPNRNRII